MPVRFHNALRRPYRVALLSAVFIFFASGCAAPQMKPSLQSIGPFESITVLAVEAPPLEVIPDLLESRMPVYRHFDNMALASFSVPILYRQPGGILIAGQMGASDSVESFRTVSNRAADNVSPARLLPAKSIDYWLPTLDLADRTAGTLNTRGLSAAVFPYFAPLSIHVGNGKLTIKNWRDAIQKWYEKDGAAGELNEPKTTAIIELCMTDYRIFANQTSLRVLMKLIDPTTKRVVSKTSQSTYALTDETQYLLSGDGQHFKSLIDRLGTQLIRQGLNELGLLTLTNGKNVSGAVNRHQNAIGLPAVAVVMTD